jgi:hypothetical protein
VVLCRMLRGVGRTVAGLGIVALLLAACATPTSPLVPAPHASYPPQPGSLSDATVCAAFNRTVSATMHPLSSYTSFAKLAAQALDAEIRSPAETLVRESRDNPSFNVAGSKDFYAIGSVCVAKGLTPKYWAELA